MGELARETSRELVVPVTGELIDLAGATDELARAIDDMRDLKKQLDSAVRTVSDEILNRMDKQAKWSATVGRYEVKGQGPGAVEYDALALRRRLVALADDGVIERDAVDAAVEKVTSYKTHARGVNALKKLGGDVEQAIEECSRPSERPRSVSISVTR